MGCVTETGKGNTDNLNEITFAAMIRSSVLLPTSASFSNSGAPYPYGKQKETHELIFSWLSWLAILLVGVYARRPRRRSHLTWGL